MLQMHSFRSSNNRIVKILQKSLNSQPKYLKKNFTETNFDVRNARNYKKDIMLGY